MSTAPSPPERGEPLVQHEGGEAGCGERFQQGQHSGGLGRGGLQAAVEQGVRDHGRHDADVDQPQRGRAVAGPPQPDRCRERQQRQRSDRAGHAGEKNGIAVGGDAVVHHRRRRVREPCGQRREQPQQRMRAGGRARLDRDQHQAAQRCRQGEQGEPVRQPAALQGSPAGQRDRRDAQADQRGHRHPDVLDPDEVQRLVTAEPGARDHQPPAVPPCHRPHRGPVTEDRRHGERRDGKAQAPDRAPRTVRFARG